MLQRADRNAHRVFSGCRSMRAITLAALVLMAGCVTPPSLDDPAPGSPTTLPWQLNECRYVVGWSQADPAIVQANLPEGFTVSTGGPLGLPTPGPTQRAIIGTEAFDCPSGSGLAGTVEPMSYASIWIPVTPPEELADPDVSAVYYKFDVLVPDAPRREAMLALGLPVTTGEIAWTQPPVPDSRGADLSLAEVGDFHFELLAPRSVAAAEGGAFMEITPANDGASGYAIWKAEFEWNEDSFTQGNGYIDWPAGHWVTEAIGTARAPAQFHAGTWSFNGTLTLPTAAQS